MTPFGIRKKIALSFLFIFSIWAGGLIWFYSQVPQTKKDFSNNSAYAVVILTGGNNRLEYGLDLLANNAAEIAFISGVGKNVSIDDILRQAPVNIRKKISPEQIILGHQAENTIGNAQEVKEWLKDSTANIEKIKIILVTSNYHIPRSLLEFSSLMPDLTVITAPVIADDNEMIFSEYHKYLASKLRHLFISTTKAQ